MAVFLCRWPNGTISIVEAKNKTDANLKLNEFGNADEANLFRLREFLMDLRLTDEGALELNYEMGEVGFGDETISQIMEDAYPNLGEALDSDDEGVIRKAVELERNRLWGKKKNLPEPKTEWAKRVQKSIRSSAVYADRVVERTGDKILKKFRPPKKGKPN